MQPPRAPKRPYQHETHGDVRDDPYHWLRDKDDPAVREYLETENEYVDEVLRPVHGLKRALFRELKGRLKERDATVPAKDGLYWYFSRWIEGKEYPVHCRRKGTEDGEEEIILDCNVLAENHPYHEMGALDWSFDHRILAYSEDIDGSEKYTLRFKSLCSDEDPGEVIEETYYGTAWARDNKTFFYVKLNDQLRPYRVYRHRLGTDPALDELVFEEPDSRFFVSLWVSSSGEYIFIHSHGVNTSEQYYLRADDPEGEFRSLAPRVMGIEYAAEHQGDRFLIHTNEDALDFKIMTAPTSAPDKANWCELIPHEEGRLIDNFLPFKDYLVLFYKKRAIEMASVMDLRTGETHEIKFPEEVYAVAAGDNYEYDTTVLRLRYSSLITPKTVFDYDMEKRTLTVKKVQEIPSGYDKSRYATEMVWATARDGKKVPISLMYRKDTAVDGGRPCYLYAYGAYGYGISPSFSPHWLSLADRGFVAAIAHVRGGDDLGRSWYEDGKLLKKTNTFYDFIDCAQALIDMGYTRPGRIVGVGGSAGGMLIGAVANMAPKLFGALVAHVPFVDCLSTMLDDTLPLTAAEYNEWGNPHEKIYYDAIKEYSPYDNVKPQAYPHMLVTAGFNDPRVTYWEPAKWVCRLRELKKDGNMLLLKTNMKAGHAGASGRFEALREKALEYAFVLYALDMVPET